MYKSQSRTQFTPYVMTAPQHCLCHPTIRGSQLGPFGDLEPFGAIWSRSMPRLYQCWPVLAPETNSSNEHGILPAWWCTSNPNSRTGQSHRWRRPYGPWTPCSTLPTQYSTFDIGAIFPSKTPGRLGRGARGTSRDRISTSTGNCRGVHL